VGGVAFAEGVPALDDGVPTPGRGEIEGSPSDEVLVALANRVGVVLTEAAWSPPPTEGESSAQMRQPAASTTPSSQTPTSNGVGIRDSLDSFGNFMLILDF
jgi:hypothetical protein